MSTEPTSTSLDSGNSNTPDSSATGDRPASTQATAAKAIHRDIACVPNGHLEQRLDVFLPESGGEPFPTILALHGGGFISGSKSFYTGLADHFSDMGYAFVAADYRLAPEFPFPAQVEDVVCALAWIEANHEEYGFDVDRVVVMGDSAGGNLAAMIVTGAAAQTNQNDCPSGAASHQIRGAILFYAPYDFTIPKEKLPANALRVQQAYFGGPLDEVPNERFIAASPIHHVDGSEPPFLLIHGEADRSVFPWEAEEFHAELDAAGVDVELLMIRNAGYAFIQKSLESDELTQSIAAIEPFLASILDG